MLTSPSHQTALAGSAFVAGEPEVLDAWRGGPARLLPPLSLRELAAVFATPEVWRYPFGRGLTVARFLYRGTQFWIYPLG